MQALEREVGGALFVRFGRRVELTDMGSMFLPYARRALESCGFHIKVAIVALARGITTEQASTRLDAVDGDVRRAVAQD